LQAAATEALIVRAVLQLKEFVAEAAAEHMEPPVAVVWLCWHHRAETGAEQAVRRLGQVAAAELRLELGQVETTAEQVERVEQTQSLAQAHNMQVVVAEPQEQQALLLERQQVVAEQAVLDLHQGQMCIKERLARQTQVAVVVVQRVQLCT
jgi:hypothetical protein